MSSLDEPGTARSRFGHFVEFAIWLTVAAGMWAYSYAFDKELSTYALGPVWWPRIIIILITLAAIGAFAADWRARRLQHASSHGASTSADTPDVMDSNARMRVAAALIVPLVYVWLLPLAGYFATTPIFLATYMYVLGINRWRTILIVTAATYLMLLLLFSKLLYIPLPTGNWPGFYDFSNWLLILLRN
jgi:hypothetical protein